ncbi:MAG TPA: polysaccharide pyruvyl transferase family protein [Virgibacillus sp.]|nr:polysaccharide pyruvyl transferase family protein [Virgibacillus sp.]
MKKRMLVNAYFAKNVGDDLFLKVLFDRYPHVKWDLLTANRNYRDLFKEYANVNIIYSYRDVAIGKKNVNLYFVMNKLFNRFRKYDAFIMIGGSIFMQSPAWKMKLAERDYLVNQFKKMNKKAFILGANFGPFTDKEFTRQYRDLFMKYDDVCFRDTYSYELFKDMDNVRVAPDVVFNLEDQKSKQTEKTIGFSTIDVASRESLRDYTAAYHDKIVQLAEGYIEAGYHIKLFSFCENEGDLKGIRQIKDQVKPTYRSHITISNYHDDLPSFLDEFKRCETIIGTRFHAIILAMLYQQSFYPLIYSGKVSNLLQDVNMSSEGCLIQEIEKLDVKHVIATAKYNKLVDEQLFADAAIQFEKLDQFIG